MTYGGKPITSLPDRVLDIAATDCANQIAALTEAGPNYAAKLEAVQAIADAVTAEKARRAG